MNLAIGVPPDPAPPRADGHVAALRALFSDRALRCAAYNLGTGTGITVLEMIKARILVRPGHREEGKRRRPNSLACGRSGM